MFLKKVRNIFCFSEAKNVSEQMFSVRANWETFNSNVSSFAGAFYVNFCAFEEFPMGVIVFASYVAVL